MDFKVIFINHKTSKQINNNFHTYEEVLGMLNCGKIILEVNGKVEMFGIVDKIYNINKKGFAIFLKETELA